MARPNNFRIYCKLTKVELEGSYTKTVIEQIQVAIRHAARAYLRAMILKVPIWTGFTRGAIKFAQGSNGDLAQYLNVAIPITGTHKTPKWYYHEPGSGVKIRKTPENGGRYGFYNFTDGGGARHLYAFSYRSSVIQFLINEFARPTGAVPSAPWWSLKAGRRAFKETLREEIKKIKKIKKAFVKTPIVINSDKVI